MKRKSFYSIKDFYFAVISIYFSSIEKTHHYKEVHEKHVSWSEVIETVLLSKSRRRKGNKIVIENKKYYILAELKDKILYIINAKRKAR